MLMYESLMIVVPFKKNFEVKDYSSLHSSVVTTEPNHRQRSIRTKVNEIIQPYWSPYSGFLDQTYPNRRI